MDVPIVCPKCGRLTRAPKSSLGHSGRCAGCGEVFELRRAVEKIGPPLAEAAYGRDGRLKVTCPECAKKFRLAPELAGKQAMCLCGTRLRISPEPSGKPGGTGAKRPKKPKAEAKSASDEEPISYSFLTDDLDDRDEAAQPLAGAEPIRRGSAEEDEGGWKWWYYVVVGILLGAFSLWQIVDGQPIIRIGGRRGGPVGGLLLSALCVAIGLFSRPGKSGGR